MRSLYTVLLPSILLALSGIAYAGGDDFETECEGEQEVPAVFTEAECEFEAEIEHDGIEFELSYEDLEGDILQAHIHFGQEGSNGGVVVFLCTNLGNNPPGATLRECPTAPGEVKGTIVAADVLAIADQAFPAGDLEALLEAMEDELTYVNVHSSAVPSGEIRGQIEED